MSNYPLTLLYDGSCPICQLQMLTLTKRDRNRQLRFIDASFPEFDAGKYGLTLAEIMLHIHGIKPDGSVVKGIEVMNLAYRATGLGWLTAASSIPAFKPLFDWGYARVANNRYRLSERLSGLIFHLAARRAENRHHACKNGACVRKHAQP